jgi:hypothetical protein
VRLLLEGEVGQHYNVAMCIHQHLYSLPFKHEIANSSAVLLASFSSSLALIWPPALQPHPLPSSEHFGGNRLQQQPVVARDASGRAYSYNHA